MDANDARNPFLWRAKYNDLAAEFIKYANHDVRCRSILDDHNHTEYALVDDRIVCEQFPCTCGLISVLETINATIQFVLPAPPSKKVVEFKRGETS